MNWSSQQYRQHGCAGWPDSKLVPNPTIQSKHKNYLHIIVCIVFLFCHMFQIKRLRSACSVLYLQRKSNTIVLMYVNLFFIKRIKASIIDSRKSIKYWHTCSAANRYLDFNPSHAIKRKAGWKIKLKHPTV